MHLRTILLIGVAACGLAAPTALAGDSTDVVGTALQQIDTLRDSGKAEEAAEHARQLVAEHPGELLAHLAHQDAELALGRQEQLVADYEVRAKNADATADDAYLLGRLLSGAPAVGSYRTAISRNADHFWAHCGLGTELLALGKLPAAERALKKATELDEDSGVPVNQLARLAEARGKRSDALELYAKAIDLSPDLAIARVNLGVLQTALGKHDAARETLDEAVDIAPRFPTAWMALGLAHAAADRPDDAAQAFDRAAQLDGGTALSLVLLANAYVSLERLDSARETLDRALMRDDDNVSAWIVSSYLEIAQGDDEGGRRAAQRAVDLDDESAEARHLLGLCEERLGQLKKAKSHFERAARIDPHNPRYVRALALHYEGQADWKDAIKQYRKVVKMTDGSAPAFYELAMAYWNDGKHDRAEGALEGAVEADPDHLLAWLNLGVVRHQHTRDRRGAAKAYRTYLSKGGKDARVDTWLTQVD